MRLIQVIKKAFLLKLLLFQLNNLSVDKNIYIMIIFCDN